MVEVLLVIFFDKLALAVQRPVGDIGTVRRWRRNIALPEGGGRHITIPNLWLLACTCQKMVFYFYVACAITKCHNTSSSVLAAPIRKSRSIKATYYIFLHPGALQTSLREYGQYVHAAMGWERIVTAVSLALLSPHHTPRSKFANFNTHFDNHHTTPRRPSRIPHVTTVLDTSRDTGRLTHDVHTICDFSHFPAALDDTQWTIELRKFPGYEPADNL
jgi:hypothetical protein